MSPGLQLLRVLLWLFPPGHRRRYGVEMLEVAAFRVGGARGIRRVWAVVVAGCDLVWSALGVWVISMRRRGRGMGSGLGLDIRFVARSLRRSPGYAATVVLVLGAAVAVNATVGSFVRGTLLDTPTYPGADRVVVAWGSNAVDGQLRDVVSGPTFLDLSRENRTLEALAAFNGSSATLEYEGRPAVVGTHDVSVDFFRVVPVTPFLGRVFGEEDRSSSAPQTVLVSYGFWRDYLGADPGWVGRALPMDGEPHTVVGVLPEGFEFVQPMPLWRPLRDDVLAADDRYRIHYHLFGRTRAGVTPGEATRDLTEAMNRVSREYPGFEGWSVLVERLHDAEVLAVRPILWTVTAAVALVLLVALMNLATLFRIRTLQREEELAVRTALGGGKGRVARLLAMESLGLALAGVGLGLVVAPWLLSLVREMVPARIVIPDSAAQVPALQAVLDPWVAGATALVALVGALALNAPALLKRVGVRTVAWGGRGSGRTRGVKWLVMAELALGTVLCLAAVLTTRSAERLLAVDMGVEDQGLLTVYFGDVWDRPIPEQVDYFRQVVEAVERLPGVASVALEDYIPFEGEDDFARVYFLDRSSQPTRDLREEWRRVSAGVFQTLGTPLQAGRGFVDGDMSGPPRVAVVNESFARKHYSGGAAVGQFVSTHDAAYQNLEIVGVVADVRANGPSKAPPPILYVPLQGSPRGTSGMYVRMGSDDVLGSAEAVRQAIWSVDSSQPVDAMRPMTQLVSAWVAIPRTTRRLVSALAALALLLAGVGVFGVTSFAVRTRTREWGVRMALGASAGRLEGELLRGAVPLVVLGVGAGLLAGVVAAQAARSVLFGIESTDPLSLALAVLVMGASGLLAAWLPVRRIARIDPTQAIRSE